MWGIKDNTRETIDRLVFELQELKAAHAALVKHLGLVAINPSAEYYAAQACQLPRIAYRAKEQA